MQIQKQMFTWQIKNLTNTEQMLLGSNATPELLCCHVFVSVYYQHAHMESIGEHGEPHGEGGTVL